MIRSGRILRAMFDEPDEPKSEVAGDPAERAREKSDEFRMHAEFCAVFEGRRKFEAAVVPTLDAGVAREIQRTIGRLEKSKSRATVWRRCSICDARDFSPTGGLACRR